MTDMTARHPGARAFRFGIALTALAALLTVWTTIVRDDSTGEAYFMLLLAIGVGGFAARFEPMGLARTMLGVAAMQVLLGMLVATAPATALQPDGVARSIVFNTVFALLWLGCAALFRAAGRAAG